MVIGAVLQAAVVLDGRREVIDEWWIQGVMA